MNGTIIALLALVLLGVMISLVVQYCTIKEIEKQQSENLLPCNIGDEVYLVFLGFSDRWEGDKLIGSYGVQVMSHKIKNMAEAYEYSAKVLNGKCYLDKRRAELEVMKYEEENKRKFEK